MKNKLSSGNGNGSGDVSNIASNNRRKQKPREAQFVKLRKTTMTMPRVLQHVLQSYDAEAVRGVQLCDGANITSAGAVVIGKIMRTSDFNPCAVERHRLPEDVRRVNEPRRNGMKFKLFVTVGGRRGFQGNFRKALLEYKRKTRALFQSKSSTLDLSVAIAEAVRCGFDWAPFVKLKHGNSRSTAADAPSSPESETSSSSPETDFVPESVQIDSVESRYKPPLSFLDGVWDERGDGLPCETYDPSACTPHWFSPMSSPRYPLGEDFDSFNATNTCEFVESRDLPMLSDD